MRWWSGTVAALAFLVAACTQPAPDNGIASARDAGSGPTSAGAGGVVDDPVKLAQCLREQGVPANDPATPDGKPGIPETVTGEQLDAAMVHCRQYAGPNYGKEPAPPDPDRLELLRRFAQCMRDQGVDWEDPGPDGRPKERDQEVPPRARDRQGPGQNGDPQLVVAAAKVCNEKVPGAGVTVEGTDGPKGSDPTR